LRQFLPPAASVANPVDMIASAGAEEFRQAAEILLDADEVDALIVLTIDVGLADLAAIARNVESGVANARARAARRKPVLTCIIERAQATTASGNEAARLPNYAFPENAARILGKLARYADWRADADGVVPEFDDIDPQEARKICRQAHEAHAGSWLSVDETRRVLGAFGLPLAAGGICHEAEEATRIAGEIGFPVALKLASRTIVHKTEFGGVRLNLTDPATVKQAFTAIQQRLAAEERLDEMEGVLVQPMISGGVEVMVGVTQDPLFGPLLGFGLGGIHVEILKDVCFRVTPITDRDAADMVRSIKGYRLLEGYRGHPPADVAAIEDLLLRVARLVEEVPAITELDMNPVMALPPGRGCLIVDARIRLGV
jgi:acyl-CoA synthetase (NDP forming)